MFIRFRALSSACSLSPRSYGLHAPRSWKVAVKVDALPVSTQSHRNSNPSNVELADIASYIHIQVNFEYDDICRRLSELVDVLEYTNAGSLTEVSLPDAKIMVEEVGASAEDLESFLASRIDIDRSMKPWTRQEDNCADDVLADQSEYDGYPGQKHLLALARKRGAKVEASGAGYALITCANGYKVTLKHTNSSHFTNQLERLRVLRELYKAGIRGKDTGLDIPRWCSICKSFQDLNGVNACTYHSCLNKPQ